MIYRLCSFNVLHYSKVNFDARGLVRLREFARRALLAVAAFPYSDLLRGAKEDLVSRARV